MRCLVKTRSKRIFRKKNKCSWLKPRAALPYNDGIPLYGNAMNSRFRLPLLALTLACALSACGQKGGLYMPEQGRNASTLPATADAAAESSDSESTEPTKEQKK
jgi:predicted small lipoprotein YifL